MRKCLLFLLFAAMLPFLSSAQVKFQKTYGGNQEDHGKGVCLTNDGGYVVCGMTKSYGAGNFDVFLYKTDADGDTLWINTYGGTNLDEGWYVEQTSDNGYIITGSTKSYGAGQTDVYLVKTDLNGTLQWSKAFGTFDFEHGRSVQQTTDNGYIVGGYIYVAGSDYNFYLIKTDANGDTLWTRTYGGGNGDVAWEALQTTDGGYVMAGQTVSYGAGNNDVYVVKTDASGSILWTKTYGTGTNDYGYSIKQTTDGGYIIGGATESYGAGLYDMFLIKTDAAGDTLWTKAYGGAGHDYINAIEQTTDGGYVAVGYTESFGVSQTDIYMLRTDASGVMLWSRIFGYGGIGNEQGNSVKQTVDGGFLLAAYTDSYGAGMGDAQLIKTDADGITGCNEFAPPTITSSASPAVGSGGVVGSGADVASPAAANNTPTVTIEVLCYCDQQLPTAAFTFTTTNLTADFIDASTPLPISGWIWDFDDGSPLDNNQNPSHTFAVTGTYNVCLSALNLCGTNVTCDSVSVAGTPPGISENSLLNDMSVYPNPTSEKFVVTIAGIHAITSVLFMNVLGEEVWADYSTDKQSYEITVSDYPSGIYYLKVEAEDGVVTKKVVRQ